MNFLKRRKDITKPKEKTREDYFHDAALSCGFTKKINRRVGPQGAINNSSSEEHYVKEVDGVEIDICDLPKNDKLMMRAFITYDDSKFYYTGEQQTSMGQVTYFTRPGEVIIIMIADINDAFSSDHLTSEVIEYRLEQLSHRIKVIKYNIKEVKPPKISESDLKDYMQSIIDIYDEPSIKISKDGVISIGLTHGKLDAKFFTEFGNFANKVEKAGCKIEDIEFASGDVTFDIV